MAQDIIAPDSDSDFSDGFGDGFSSDDSFGSDFADFSSDNTADSETSSSAVVISGTAGLDGRYFINGFGAIDSVSDLLDNRTALLPQTKIALEYENANTSFQLVAKISDHTLLESPGEIIDEAVIALYGDKANFYLGRQKITWGKADSLHVLDVINAQNLYDFINQDPQDFKIAADMLKVDIPIGMMGMLEAVYLPFRQSSLIPTTGNWIPSEVTTKLSEAKQLIIDGPNGNDGLYMSIYAPTFGGMYAAAAAELYQLLYESTYTSTYNTVYANELENNGGDAVSAAAIASWAAHAAAEQAIATQMGVLAPGLQTQAAALAGASAEAQADEMVAGLLDSTGELSLNDGQFGIRYTDSFGPLDLGIQYYYGFEKTPIMPEVTGLDLTELQTVSITYPRVHIAGLDAAFALGSYSFRVETAFSFLKEEYDNYFSYAAGVDGTIPFINLDLNIQAMGIIPLEGDTLATTRIAAQVSDLYLNDTLQPELIFAMNIADFDIDNSFNLDYFIYPRITWFAFEGASLSAGYKYFWGDTGGNYSQFNDNSFIELALNYTF